MWSALKTSGRKALIPYLTAGYPTPAASADALKSAAEVADILEVGIPFSDPLADGPTIQRASYEALRQGMSLARTLDLIARSELACPVVVFSYLNPILRYGVEPFLHAAEELGIAGLLLTDLPAGSDPAVEAVVSRSQVDLIRLIAPTTVSGRLTAALQGAQGFVYLVARLGVTGARESLAADLAESVERVRRATPLPVAVGFGISTPEQARAAGRMADGVVVGSALVEILGREGIGAARSFLGSLRQALDTGDAG
ncbi:MAG: tryptophan synthase subunit alpha [Gemmatimonadales bacterium]